MKNKDRKSLAPGALTAPIPPAMVTVGNYNKSNILTIAWTGILATQPPKTYISVRPSRHSYEMLKETGEFVINLPSVSLARETDYVGIYTGAKVDKWQKCNLTKQKSEKVDAPTIAECPIALECRVTDVIPMGSHDVFIADIVSVSCHGDIIDDKGKMRFDRADLLAYAHGEYYSLGEIVGRFGFSTDKPEKEDKTNKKLEKQGKNTEKKPFYENAPRSRSPKKKPTDKNKGAPHGRRGGAKK
ncbi:MAG: flavin reductase family protein [Clostridia bacterium]|nr:flavin reductase family protein [Clostridia bacterium]